MRPTARRICLAVLAASAAFGALLLLLSLVQVDATLNEKDFGQEYLLARAILDGVDPYQPIQVLGARYVAVTGYFDKPYPTPHPPTVGLLALPLGLLGYPTAVRLWLGFELACLVGAVGLLIRGAGLPLRLGIVPVLALALVAWPPVTLELGLGQLMLPLLLGLAGAQAALLARRSVLGGGLLAVTLLVKPIAWPWLIVLAWRRDWRALAAAAGVVVAGGVLSVVAIGLAPVTNYFARVLPAAVSGTLGEPTNISLWTIAPRLGQVGLSGVVPAAVLLLAIAAIGRGIPLRSGLALMTVASLLVSPLVWSFYLVLALLPVMDLFAALWSRGPRRVEVAAALGVVVLLSLSQSGLLALGRSGFGPGILLAPALGLILLGGMLAWLKPAYSGDGDRAG